MMFISKRRYVFLFLPILGLTLFTYAAELWDLQKKFLLAQLQIRLETRFPKIQIVPHSQIEGVIVLGGDLERVREASRLAKRFPEAHFVFTSRSKQEHQLIQSIGLRPENMTIEAKAKNTYENGLNTAEILDGDPKGTWLLITSALHMPRSMGVFQALNVPVEPWPVFSYDEADRTLEQQIIHEVFGLIYYRLKGRTNDVFPGPA